MPSQNSPPFPRGESFTQYEDDQNVDSSQSPVEEGKEFYFDDKDFIGAVGGVVPDRTNKLVKCRIMRNKSSGALLPKRWVKHTAGSTPQQTLGQVAGYATAIGDFIAGVVDEHLPAAGVADGDMFWVVVDGPSKVTTDGSGDTNIPVGGSVIPATNGTSVQGVDAAAGNTQADVTAALLLARNCPGICLVAVNATSTDFYANVKVRGMN